MKTKITLITIFFITISFSQSKNTLELFAIMQGQDFRIVGDTLRVKSEVTNLVLSDHPHSKLIVEIIKGQTLGEKIEEFYYLLLRDKKNNVTLARWLEKIDNNLYFVTKFVGSNYWQVLTTACIGPDDCNPQVAIIDSTKQWVCGTALVCKIESNCKKISAIGTD